MTCCILANRPQKLPWRFQEEDPRCMRLKELLRSQLSLLVTEHGVRHFLSGMERGVDTYAAELVLDLRETYPISLECVLSSEEQAVAWLERERDRFLTWWSGRTGRRCSRAGGRRTATASEIRI